MSCISSSDKNCLRDLMNLVGIDVLIELRCQSPDDVIKDVFDILKKNVPLIESMAKNHQDTGEEGLSDLIVLTFQNTGYRCSREEQTRGHVDITIDHVNLGISVLGESKIWGGPSYHKKACIQLIGYMTGRHKHGFVVEFHKKRNMYHKHLRLQRQIEKEMSAWCGCVHCSCDNSCLKGTFITSHNHSSGSRISIKHICVNMFIDN